MPIITIESGKLNKEQKRDLIRRLTDVASEITGTPGKFFAITVKELDDENLGFAGETVEEIKSRMKK